MNGAKNLSECFLALSKYFALIFASFGIFGLEAWMEAKPMMITEANVIGIMFCREARS